MTAGAGASPRPASARARLRTPRADPLSLTRSIRAASQDGDVSDDPIRDLLAGATRHDVGLPVDYVAAPLGHVEAHGGDLEAVRAWVEAHGGWMERRPAPRRTGLRPDRLVEPVPARFVIPASALMPAPSARSPT